MKDVYAFQVNNQNILVSGGWDCMVKFWSINGACLQIIGQCWVGKPVHLLSGSYPLLVTAHSERFIHLWNLQNIFQGKFDPVNVLESPLKYETSSIQCFADGKGFAIGSIEGRCGIVNLDLMNPSNSSSLDFCFKCHRAQDPKTKQDNDIFTVNCLSFNK